MTSPDTEQPTNVPVPSGRRMQLAIKRWLPIAFFGLSCIACLLLFQFQSRSITLLGEVEVLEFTINSAENGIVSSLVPGQTESELTFTNIDKDQLVAVLDDRFLTTRLGDATATLEALQRNIDADAELKSITSTVEMLAKEQRIVSSEMRLRKLEPADTDERQKLSFEIEKLRAEIGFAAMENLTDEEPSETVQLQFAKHKIRTVRAELAAISRGIAHLDARSPIEGRITKLHVKSGDSVVAGQPLLTLVPTQGRHAIAFAPDNSNTVPFVGMPVTIRSHTTPAKEHATRINAVGPAIESIPSRQRAMAQIEEWGRPIRVKIPSSMELAPGSLVEILIDSSAASQ